MSIIIEGGFGKKPPKEKQTDTTEQVVVEEVDVQAVAPESAFYPFSLPDECFTTYCLNVLNVR